VVNIKVKCNLERKLTSAETEILYEVFEARGKPIPKNFMIGEIYERLPTYKLIECQDCIHYVSFGYGMYCINQEYLEGQ